MRGGDALAYDCNQGDGCEEPHHPQLLGLGEPVQHHPHPVIRSLEES